MKKFTTKHLIIMAILAAVIWHFYKTQKADPGTQPSIDGTPPPDSRQDPLPKHYTYRNPVEVRKSKPYNPIQYA